MELQVKRQITQNQNAVFISHLLNRTGLVFQAEFRFHPTRKWRFDFCCPEYKIAIEIDGGVFIQGRHTRPLGYINDMEKLNNAAAMNYRVFRITPKQKFTPELITLIKTAVNGYTN